MRCSERARLKRRSGRRARRTRNSLAAPVVELSANTLMVVEAAASEKQEDEMHCLPPTRLPIPRLQYHQPTNQSINQPIKQSIKQSIKQPINQSLHLEVGEAEDEEVEAVPVVLEVGLGGQSQTVGNDFQHRFQGKDAGEDPVRDRKHSRHLGRQHLTRR